MEDLVTYQICKKLKEKGFPINGKEIICGDNGVFIPTPTISQVLKWLREEKSIYVAPCVIEDCDTDADCRIINRFTFWSFDIQIVETGDIIYSEYENIGDNRFDSYEEAALHAIEYVLDSLI